jgi:8-oxo-dGTP pyrophosphatase MutT (NUDIX family)
MIDAAVLIPVYRSQDEQLHIVMVLRKPGGVHGGQIAFPGGKHDPVDETMLDTALREAHEELGLTVLREDILAELPIEQTRTTGYRVFPYVARITPPSQWRIAEREIAEIIDVNLRDLTHPNSHRRMIERFPTWQKAERVSYYQIGSHRLWGLSYRILQPIISRLGAGEWEV